MPNRLKNKEQEVSGSQVQNRLLGNTFGSSDNDHQRIGLLTDNVRTHSNFSESDLDDYKTKISRQTASLINRVL